MVELGVEEHAGRRILAAGRDAVDPHAGQVVVGVLARDGPVPEDAVGKAGVLDVVPADVVERLRSVGRPHAVHLDDDEAEVRQRREPPPGAERLGNERALRAGIDALDDRVFPRRVEVLGPADDAPDVRLAVATLGHEDLGRTPAAGLERRDVGLLEFADELAILGASKLVDRGHVHAAVGVDEVMPVGRELHRVVAVPRRQRDQARCRRN